MDVLSDKLSSIQISLNSSGRSLNSIRSNAESDIGADVSHAKEALLQGQRHIEHITSQVNDFMLNVGSNQIDEVDLTPQVRWLCENITKVLGELETADTKATRALTQMISFQRSIVGVEQELVVQRRELDKARENREFLMREAIKNLKTSIEFVEKFRNDIATRETQIRSKIAEVTTIESRLLSYERTLSDLNLRLSKYQKQVARQNALGGLPIALCGLILAPVTSGASLGLTFAGAAFAVAGPLNDHDLKNEISIIQSTISNLEEKILNAKGKIADLYLEKASLQNGLQKHESNLMRAEIAEEKLSEQIAEIKALELHITSLQGRAETESANAYEAICEFQGLKPKLNEISKSISNEIGVLAVESSMVEQKSLTKSTCAEESRRECNAIMRAAQTITSAQLKIPTLLPISSTKFLNTDVTNPATLSQTTSYTSMPPIELHGMKGLDHLDEPVELSETSVLPGNDSNTCADSSLSPMHNSPMTSDENDTSTDSNSMSDSDQPSAENLRNTKKHELVNRLMVEFYQLFSTRRYYNAHPNAKHTQETCRCNSQASKGGRKRQALDHPENSNDDRPGDSNEDAEGEGDGSGQHSEDILENAPTESRRFACPYFKRNRAKYATWRSCPGPGWHSVHRLKEHLYRRHMKPIQCPRCWQAMDNSDRLESHLQASPVCDIKEKIMIEGFDKKQEEKLKSRKRNHQNQTEEQRWKELYNILFPEDNEQDIPSPYYDYDIVPESGRSTQLARYEEFLSRELPRRVRSLLEAAVDRALEPLEEGLRDQLVEIVQMAQMELFQTFRAQHLEQRDLEVNLSPDVAITQPNSLETDDIDPAVFSFQPFVFDGDWFDPSTFSFHIPLSGSESGYDSIARNDLCNVNNLEIEKFTEKKKADA